MATDPTEGIIEKLGKMKLATDMAPDEFAKRLTIDIMRQELIKRGITMPRESKKQDYVNTLYPKLKDSGKLEEFVATYSKTSKQPKIDIEAPSTSKPPEEKVVTNKQSRKMLLSELTKKEREIIESINSWEYDKVEAPSCDEMRASFKRGSDPVPEGKKPIAFILAGPIASGKSTALYNMLPTDFDYDIYNRDDYIEYIATLNGLISKLDGKKVNRAYNKALELISSSYAKLSPINLSPILFDEFIKWGKKSATSIQQSYNGVVKRCYDEDMERLMSSTERRNIVFDTMGNNIKEVLSLKGKLEKLGYVPYMVFVYASKETTLQSNNLRYRSLAPTSIDMTWDAVLMKIAEYETAFGKQFILIDNEAEGIPVPSAYKIGQQYKFGKPVDIFVPLFKDTLAAGEMPLHFKTVEEGREIIKDFITKNQSGGRRKKKTSRKSKK